MIYFDTSNSKDNLNSKSLIEETELELKLELETLKENLELEYLWQLKKDYDDYLNDYPEFY